MHSLPILFVFCLIGCSQPQQQETGTEAYLGEWHRAKANCTACDRWVISRTEGEELRAVRMITADLVNSPVTTQYEAGMVEDRIMVSQKEEQAQGVVLNSRHSLMGKSYKKFH